VESGREYAYLALEGVSLTVFTRWTSIGFDSDILNAEYIFGFFFNCLYIVAALPCTYYLYLNSLEVY
jgi:hypothetical protein